MRILLINTLYAPIVLGGAEKSVQELAIELTTRGHHVAVFSLIANQREALKADLLDGVTVYRSRSSSMRYFQLGARPFGPVSGLMFRLSDRYRPLIRRRLKSVIEDFQPEIIHSNVVAGIGNALVATDGSIPRVHTLRDYYLVCATAAMRRGSHNCEGQCFRCRFITQRTVVPSHSLQAWVGVSNAILRDHEQLVKPLRQSIKRVIYNAPDAPRAEPEHSPVNVSRSQVITIGFIGRLVPHKGLAQLVEAFRSIHDRDVRLVIAGAAPAQFTEWATDLTSQDSRITLIGRVAPARFYATVDIVAVPSQWREPFGRVAAEAAAAGCRVAVSHIGGLPEAIAEYSRGITVRDYARPAAWATTLADLILQHRVDSVRRPARTVAAMSPGHQYEALYRDLLNAPVPEPHHQKPLWVRSSKSSRRRSKFRIWSGPVSW